MTVKDLKAFLSVLKDDGIVLCEEEGNGKERKLYEITSIIMGVNDDKIMPEVMHITFNKKSCKIIKDPVVEVYNTDHYKE